jgi:hypothetical protein
MSTLPPCADGFNNRGDEPSENPTSYSARPSGHPDEGMAFEEDDPRHRAMVAELHHEMAINFGDDAVNADAAIAEAKLRQAFPDVETVTIVREQERFASKTFWTEFITRWRVRMSGSHSATGLSLDAAVKALVAQAKPNAGLLPPA